MSDQPPINLKCENPWFSDVYSGRKNFEVRVDDRGYKEGMLVNLLEYDRAKDLYLGRSVQVRITYILHDRRFVKVGTCVFGFERVRETSEHIPVTTTLSPSTYKFIADMARTNGVDVPSLVSAIVEERVKGTQRAYPHKETDGINP